MASADSPLRHADTPVEFGPFRLDPVRRRLTREGAPVPLGDRAFQILQVLVRHAPAVVSKATLFEEVWPGTFIEESTLRFHLSTLRKALDDGNRYISTASGRGYCFVAALSPLPVVPEPADDLPASRTNLPLRLTNLIGRERELAELADGLRQSRLVTLVGPGGIGKTRLAVELGWRVLEDFPAGVWLVDLAPLAHGEAVAGAVAASLSIPVTKTDATVEALVAALAKMRPLLIVDNCEHLAEAAGTLIQTLLERAPGLSILATCQKSLGLPAEQVYGLDPLEVPPAGTARIIGFAAADLFVERARAADRLFELHDGNGVGIGEICRQLDGLPLAVEMAAGRLRMLGVEGLRKGLSDRLKLLKGTPDSTPRHASLHGMLDWSHSLLAPLDRKVFRRFAIFPASFSLEAAVAVVGESEAERWLVVDALDRLIDHSLVTLEQRDPPRYRLLETLRFYAATKLQDAGEAELTAERHAHHFIALFDEAERCWETTPDPDWFAHYQPELDNLRVSLAWTLATPDRRQNAIALAAASSTLLYSLSLIAEGRRYLDRIVPLLDETTPTATAARLLSHATLFRETSRDPTALEYAERSAVLYRELRDARGLASALIAQALAITQQQRRDEARVLLLEAEQLLAGNHSPKGQLRLMFTKAVMAYHMQDIPAVQSFLSEALGLARAIRSRQEPTVLANLAFAEYLSGKVDRAIELTRAALVLRASFQIGGFTSGSVVVNLAVYLIHGGRLFEARACLQKEFAAIVGNFPTPIALQTFAVLAGVEGRLVEAAQLIGFVDAERGRLKQEIGLGPRPLYDRLMRILESGLPPAELDDRKAAGAAWTLDEAIEFAASRIMAPASEGLAAAS